MKNILKKKIALIVALMMMFVFGVNTNPLKPKAADVSVVISISASSVKVGDTVSVTVSVSGSSLSAYTMYVGYNSGVLQYVSCSGMGNGGGGSVTLSGTGSSSSATITFKAISAGTAGVSTSGSEFYSLEGTTLSVAHAGVNITVTGGSQTPATTESQTPATTEEKKPGTTTEEKTSEEEKSDNSNLIAIGVEPGQLDKEFRYDITEYTVNVSRDTKSIKVTPEKEDSTAKYTIEGADELKPGVNEVKITVVAENGYTKIYTLQVIVGELLDDAVIELDGKQYVFAPDGAGLAVPENFSPISIEYKDWEVPAYQSPNKLLTIVCLQEKLAKTEDESKEDTDSEETTEQATEETTEAPDEESVVEDITEVKAAWYIYDSVDESFTPYEELASNNNRFVIRPIPENKSIPEGYAEVEITIQNKKVTAYHSAYATDTHMYLVYAMNINGLEGFYIYDDLEQSFLRYAPDRLPEPEVSTVSDTPAPVVVEKKDEGFFTTQVLAILMFVCLGGMILFAVLMIVQIVRKRQLKEELDLAESMVEQLVSVNGADKVGAVKPVLDDNAEQKETEAVEEAQSVEEEPAKEITAEQKVVVDKANEMAAAILGTKTESQAVAQKEQMESKASKQKEETETVALSNEADALTATEKGETEEFQIDFVPEISLEDYAETSKHIQEKINDQYDAQLDSAFAPDEDSHI